VANHAARTILDHVCRTVGNAEFGKLGDDELLRVARAGRDPDGEAAFAVLVERHGPLVYHTCYVALRHTHDAEDAFQATFLVLARKANSLSARRNLGPWLYEVARRVAAHAKAAALRRERHERLAAGSESREDPPDKSEPTRLLHAALDRLPARFRLPIVLCDLEELSYQDAAERLGWTLPTIRNRLSRGRRRLQTALRRLGLDSNAALVAYGTMPSVSRLLISSTAQTARQMALGAAGASAPAAVIALTNQGIQTMLLIKLKTIGLAVVTSALLIAGAYEISGQPVPKGKPGDAAGPVAKAPDSATGAMVANAGPGAIVSRLTGPASIDKPIEGESLKDVLDFLSERYVVTFIFDNQAFERIGKANVADTQIRLQKMPGVTLDTILRHVLGQVGGTVLVRSNHLEVTTTDQASVESRNGVSGELSGTLPPLVNLVCEQGRLEQVLSDIARQSGRNIVLDPRVKDRERIMITVTLLNTPTDTAVRVIAEMANLKSVAMDNVLFVTTVEYASALIADDMERAEQRKAANASPAPPSPKPK
jgi:RNA polymerase sigma factor (sigma-70 family)